MLLSRFDSINKAELRAALSATTANDVASWETLIRRETETAQAHAQLATEIRSADDNMNASIKAAQQRQAAAKKRLEYLRATVAAKRSASATLADYQRFVERSSQLYAELALRRDTFAQVATYSPHDLRFANLDAAYAYASNWVAFSDGVERQIGELSIDAKTLAAHGGAAGSVDHIKKALDDTTQLFRQTVSNISREHARRETQTDSVAEFLRSQSQLVQWCRTQKSTLEHVTDPDHVQELCTSFHNNIAVMETNLLVLLELSDPLMPNETVSKALIEVNEVWLALAVYAFEKHREALLDVHVQSGLQQAAKQWSNDINDPLKSFLEKAQQLLQMPTDDESRAVTQPVLDTCIALAEEFGPHAVIVEHLTDFTVREDCLRDHYSAIRRAIFSRLTLLTLSFHCHVQYPRRQEYSDRLAELTDWVQCKSQGGAWRQLLARVTRMRQLIEENEALHGTAEERSH